MEKPKGRIKNAYDNPEPGENNSIFAFSREDTPKKACSQLRLWHVAERSVNLS
jgi:hypothetical protein